MKIDPSYVLAKARDGQARVFCPACGPSRKTKGDDSLSIKTDERGVVWHCWHCGDTGTIKNEQPKRETKMATVTPIKTYAGDEIDFAGLAYLEGRGISEATAKALGLLSGRKYFKKAGREMDAVGFPYHHGGRVTAIKWRSIEGKDFTQEGAAQTLFGADRIIKGSDLVICEGEVDASAFWEAGIPAVSIPSGAIAEGTADDAAKLKWLSHHDELIQAAPNVFLATDMDGPGEATANELARRIGKLKCWRISFPLGCKDGNDTLIKHGRDGLISCKTGAVRWPVEGVAGAADFLDRVTSIYRDGLPRGVSTGWSCVDDVFTLNPGNLVIVTGTPGSGKSQFIDAALMHAMSAHNWRIAYASFENPPELHLAKLLSMRARKPFGTGPNPRMTEDEMLEHLGWLNERVKFLTNDGVMPTVESLIERFEAVVRRDGVKAVVVDPFNFVKLSQKKDGGIDTEAINDMLAQFKTFAIRAEVVFFLIAHPAKPMNQGPDWVPTGYSIASSAHFFNRADFGLTIQRKPNETILHVWKCRFAWQGSVGQASLVYDKVTGLFNEASEMGGDDGWLKGFDESLDYDRPLN